MHTKLVVLGALLLGRATFAAELPSAGSQLQQIPSAPAVEKAAPQLQIDRSEVSAIQPADGASITVNRLHIINARAFSEAELLAATAFNPGSELTLTALRSFAAQITNFYHSHGYFLAQATLPAQDIVDGAVTLAVVEGQYGKVILRNQSKLSDALAQRLLSGLNSGDAITIAPLESRLLQLSDLPGVNVNSTLAPGASVGASDLIVDVTPGQRLSGSIDSDNSGSRYTGAYRVGATLNLNNPFGVGDVATLRALTSWEGLNYGRAAYQRQFGRLDAGVAYTALDYELGREFASLEAQGRAHIASLYARYPLLRSRSSNLHVQLGVDAKSFRDELHVTTPATISNKESDAAMLSLLGDRRDSFGGGGLNMASVTWTSGSLELESAHTLSVDAATARSNGHYDKLGFSVMRVQSVTDTFSLYAALQGQLASQNLDVSEKLGLGGATAVRAYPEGEAYVDEGYVMNVEGRLLLPGFIPHLPGQFQLIGFLDSGTGRANQDPWDTEKNRRTLNGGGLGLHWFEASRFLVKMSYAHTIGAAAATSVPDANSRFWINAVKYF